MKKTICSETRNELLKSKGVIHVSDTVIKLHKTVLNDISNNAKSSTDIKIILDRHNINYKLIGNARVKRLYNRYVTKIYDNERGTIKDISKEQKQLLLEINVITDITEKKIMFDVDFKIKIAKCRNSKDALELFHEYPAIKQIIKIGKLRNYYYRWRNILSELGVAGLQNPGKHNVTTKAYDEMNDSEKVKYLENELKIANDDKDFLKKYMPSLQKNEKSQNVYKLIWNCVKDGIIINISRILKLLEVNESGYYLYVKHQKNITLKARIDAMVTADIMHVSKKFNNRKGYRTITMELNSFYESIGLPLVNHKKVQRLMKINNIKCIIRRKNPYKEIWSATESDKISDNILNRNFKNGKPGDFILTDITYLHCTFGTAYLSAAKDLIARDIVSYVVRDDMHMELSLGMLEGIPIDRINENTHIHSDQGVHYTAKAFREQLASFGIVQSMSRRGNCIDNSPMETFFGHFKDEVEYQNCRTLAELKLLIDEYMVYYNQQRKQWTLKKMTPIEYRNQFLQQAI